MTGFSKDLKEIGELPGPFHDFFDPNAKTPLNSSLTWGWVHKLFTSQTIYLDSGEIKEMC